MAAWGSEYLLFLESFLDKEMPADEFVSRFLSINPNLSGMSEAEYLIYMDLFYEVDAFSPEGITIVGPSIDEAGLRRAAAECLRKLKALAAKPAPIVWRYGGRAFPGKS